MCVGIKFIDSYFSLFMSNCIIKRMLQLPSCRNGHLFFLPVLPIRIDSSNSERSLIPGVYSKGRMLYSLSARVLREVRARPLKRTMNDNGGS